MNRFTQVKVILDEAVEGQNIGAHGPFWRGKTRDQFVEFKVFDFVDVVNVGDGANSAIIKALRGEGMQQMPVGFPAVPGDRIAFVESWIDDGCPAGLDPQTDIDPLSGGGLDPLIHNLFWREFDNWAAFHRPPGILEAVGKSFGLATIWADVVRGNASEADFQAAAGEADTQAALELLGLRQAQSVQEAYGNPVPLLSLIEGFELFGRGVDNGGLPLDPLRPADGKHQMNGPQMWFNWCAMAEASQTIAPPLTPEFWHAYSRAILVGLLNDGVVRGRFPVSGFSAADPDVSAKIRQHALDLDDSVLAAEMRSRFEATSFNLPF